MGQVGAVLLPIVALGLIALASRQIGAQFRRRGLPLISGFLLCGAVAGPHVAGMLTQEVVDALRFVDQVAIAFIGFAAGSELYLREYRDRIRAILWVTAGISAVTMTFVALAFVQLSPLVPAIAEAGPLVALAAALLAGSILVARSPSSAIAIIKELRAWGPFTRLGLGVTVVMDALVIVLFAISAEVADVLLHGRGGGVGTVLYLLFEIGASVGAGLLVGQLLRLIFAAEVSRSARTLMVLLLGWGVFAGSDLLHLGGFEIAGRDFLLEPLLICMVAGVVMTNATPHRVGFQQLIDRTSPGIFVLFFTLTGASLSLDVLARTWQVALALFAVRLLGIMAGAFAGGMIAGEPVRQSRLLWMSFVTQAGVGLGLAKEVALEFPGWGQELATVIIAVIVLNQLVGPPLYRWVLKAVGEAHPRADAAGFDGVRDAIIFGHEGQTMGLAHQLHEHGWNVKVAATGGKHFDEPSVRGLDIHPVETIDLAAFEALDAARAECIVSMLDDDSNYRVCELAYENYGTDNLVVRAEGAADHRRFHELGVVVVDPRTAMLSLLDHMVRSPRSTSLLLGLVADRDVIEVQVGNPNLHEMRLRDLTLPEDALVLSLRRGGDTLITHGSTRLMLDDWVTVIGSNNTLDEVAVRFEGEARGASAQA